MHRNLATRVQCGILAILCLAGTAAHGQTTRNASPWLALNAAQVEAALAKAAKASGEFDRLAAASAPAVMLETRPTKSIEATLDARYQASGYRGQTWLVYLPHAEDLPGQEGVSCKVLLPANATEAKEKSPLERAVYQATADTRSRPTDVLVTKAVYSADLQSRRLVPATAAGLKQTPPADPAKDFLAPSPTIDFHAPKFQAWLDQKRLHPAGGETDLAFARRVFVAIVSNEKYDYTLSMDRHASTLCYLGKTDCGGMAIVYTATLRAHGIAARLRSGHWATSSIENARVGEVAYHQEHVKAEFFARRIGWVPVDLSSAVLYDKTPQKLTYFGNDPGDFLTLHLDTDFLLDSGTFGQLPTAWMQFPIYWTTGENAFTNPTQKIAWTVRELPRPRS